TAQYFDKKRGLANGIAVAGSGIGGLTLAPLVRFMITKIGFRWAQRIEGISMLVFMLAIFPFIKPRVNPTNKGPIFDFGLFRLPGFIALMMSCFVVTFGYMIPIFLLPSYTTSIGLSATTGANLVSIFSGINSVARIVLGVSADRLGRMNTL